MILIRYLGVNNKQTRKKSGIIVWLAVLVEAPSQWQCGLIFLFFREDTRVLGEGFSSRIERKKRNHCNYQEEETKTILFKVKIVRL